MKRVYDRVYDILYDCRNNPSIVIIIARFSFYIIGDQRTEYVWVYDGNREVLDRDKDVRYGGWMVDDALIRRFVR